MVYLRFGSTIRDRTIIPVRAKEGRTTHTQQHTPTQSTPTGTPWGWLRGTVHYPVGGGGREGQETQATIPTTRRTVGATTAATIEGTHSPSTTPSMVVVRTTHYSRTPLTG